MAEYWWDDLRFPAAAANPPGLASDPAYDTTNGGYLFDSASTELLFFQAQLSHSYREHTDIIPHVHWQKTTSAAGDVMWECAYKKARIGMVMDAAFTLLTASTTVNGTPDNDLTDEHLITTFGELPGDDLYISDMILFKVSRLGADVLDTYGADVRLIEFDVHYQVEGHGSYGQFYKTWRKGIHS